MPGRKILSEYLRELKKDMSLDDFVRRHGGPFLVDSTYFLEELEGKLKDWSPSAILVYELDLVKKEGSTVIVLGRGNDCDIILDDSTVSKKHAELYFENPNVYLRDLKSRNGTFVSGMRLKGNTGHQLKSGERFCVGSNTFDFYCVSDFYGYAAHSATIQEQLDAKPKFLLD